LPVVDFLIGFSFLRGGIGFTPGKVDCLYHIN